MLSKIKNCSPIGPSNICPGKQDVSSGYMEKISTAPSRMIGAIRAKMAAEA
jgi:hypothetical protein